MTALAPMEGELAEIEHVARALFLAEHPTAEWSAGRARSIWFTRAEAAIAAVRALPAVGDGWLLVPKTPTEAMINAYFDKARELGFLAHMNASCMWETMLGALPPPPQGEKRS